MAYCIIKQISIFMNALILPLIKKNTKLYTYSSQVNCPFIYK